MRLHFSNISIFLALIIGVMLAWFLMPSGLAQQETSALLQIVDEDPEVRRRGWAVLEANGAFARNLQGIHGRLDGASDEALLDGADALRRQSLWGWEHQPAELVLREVQLRLLRNSEDRELAAGMMARAPLDLDVDVALPLFGQLLEDARGSQFERAMEAAFGWIGPHRFHHLMQLQIFEDEETRRTARIAVYWARDRQYEKSVSSAWGRMDAEAAMVQLQRSVRDRDGMVYAAALLAEHCLPREQASALARKWIVDFNDDRKRAGALLAALLGEHAELVAEALAVTTDPLVRTTQRMALLSLGAPVGESGDIEFAHRTLHLPGGNVNPDVLLCLLAAGYEDGPRILASTPINPSGEALQARNLLIERFVPFWNIHAAVEESADPVLAYYQAMRSIWMLTHRWMEFDGQLRRWRIVTE